MQELDEAARRRLPKQVYVALPDAAARRSMLVKQLGEAPYFFALACTLPSCASS